jgi:hypothetical protein
MGRDMSTRKVRDVSIEDGTVVKKPSPHLTTAVYKDKSAVLDTGKSNARR